MIAPRFRKISLAVLWVLLFALILQAPADAKHKHKKHKRHPTTTTTTTTTTNVIRPPTTVIPSPTTTQPPTTDPGISTNVYAGYTLHPNDTPTAYTVSGQWKVPEVNCTDAPQNSPQYRKSRAAPWVGLIGRQLTNSPPTWIIQTGTISWCDNGVATYEAVVEKYHKNSLSDPFGYNDLGPTHLYYVLPGDNIHAGVTYQGRDSSTRGLKFDTNIRDESLGIYFPTTQITDSDEQEVNALWQGGCILEDQIDYSLFTGFPTYGGGLAKFTNPFKFNLCDVNLRGIDTYPSYSTFKWQMRPDGKWLATTGPVSTNGAFSVNWVDWR